MELPTHGRRTAALIQIREFEESDFPDLVALHNQVYPEYQTSESKLRHRRESQPAYLLHGRYVAIFDGRMVGFVEYWQQEGMYHPRHFEVDVQVHPEMQGRGVGGRLYAHLGTVLAPHDPLEIHALVHESHTSARAMARTLGFEEGMREWESRLLLAGWDPRPFDDVTARVAAEGVQVTPWAALAGLPHAKRNYYDLLSTVRLDVPRPVPATPYSYESYLTIYDDPNFLADGNFIALENGHFIGMSNLWKSADEGVIYTGLTGVLREVRRRGVATALKVNGLNWARAAGYREARTWNATTNRGMLQINEQMGFARQPAWIKLKWRNPAAEAGE